MRLVLGAAAGVLLLGVEIVLELTERRTYAQRHETVITGPLT